MNIWEFDKLRNFNSRRWSSLLCEIISKFSFCRLGVLC